MIYQIGKFEKENENERKSVDGILFFELNEKLKFLELCKNLQKKVKIKIVFFNRKKRRDFRAAWRLWLW